MPRINKIITNANYELVRTRIAEILTDELLNQLYLTEDEDYNVSVFVGRSHAVDISEMPCLNIIIPNGVYDNQNQGYRQGVYTFFIDLYASSKTVGANRGDKLAEDKVLKLGNAVMYIFDDPQYKTLGFEPGFIVNKRINRFSIADPNNEGDNKNSSMARIEVQVTCGENNSLIEPQLIGGFDTVWKISLTDKGYRVGNTTSLAKPYNVEISNTSSSFILTWNDINDNESGFRIYRSLSFDSGFEIIGTTTNLTFTDSTVTTDLIYYYYIDVFNDYASNNSLIVSGFIPSGGGTDRTYFIYFDGVDTGETLTFDGNDKTINLR